MFKLITNKILIKHTHTYTHTRPPTTADISTHRTSYHTVHGEVFVARQRIIMFRFRSAGGDGGSAGRWRYHTQDGGEMWNTDRPTGFVMQIRYYCKGASTKFVGVF